MVQDINPGPASSNPTNLTASGSTLYFTATDATYPSRLWQCTESVTPPPSSSIGDPGFEQVQVGAGQFQYDPAGSAWTFSGSAGISANGSGFTCGQPAGPRGLTGRLPPRDRLVQPVRRWLGRGHLHAELRGGAAGHYQASQQDFEVLVDGVVISTFTPSGTSYQSYTTAAFTVSAGSHTITFQGLDSAGGDNTAFVDQVAVAPASSSVGDPGFEQVQVGAGQFRYDPAGSAWTFSGSAGISANGSGFTWANPPAPEGSQVAFLQGNGSFSQSVAGWAAGTYTLSFEAAQRANYQASQQDFEVLVDGVVISTFTPSGTSYQSYTTAAFTVSAGSHTITFQGLDSAGGDNTAFVDEIAVAIS